MDISEANGYTLTNLNKINIVLGKNGSGKSTFIRKVERYISSHNELYGKSKYIPPERGGALNSDAGMENALSSDINWLPNQRRRNQTPNFKPQSVAQYKKLEWLVLKEIEGTKRTELDYNFDNYITKINSLLDNIEIKRNDNTFKIYKKGTATEIGPEVISSGESELISLGIECLVFSKECIAEKENFLFLDEPDVHLHPDLQVRLMHFLKGLVSVSNFKVIIVTHSTAILGALESYLDVNLSFISTGQLEIEFKPISEIYKKVLPIFGAHPLSNIFNEAPVLLVEGEDDERIWQQVVRTAEGKVKIYPCVCGSVEEISLFEGEIKNIIQSVYDKAKAYSLRDRDDTSEEDLSDDLPIIKLKLKCYSAENLLLTNEVLSSLGYTWEVLQEKINEWIEEKTGKTHAQYEDMLLFKNSTYDRKNLKIKSLRNLILGILGIDKPWEVVVGKTIAKLEWDEATDYTVDGSIYNYLGEKLVKNLLPRK
ncbi:MAG: AAA family ATPase [Minisyncoccia bacterium]